MCSESVGINEYLTVTMNNWGIITHHYNNMNAQLRINRCVLVRLEKAVSWIIILMHIWFSAFIYEFLPSQSYIFYGNDANILVELSYIVNLSSTVT